MDGPAQDERDNDTSCVPPPTAELLRGGGPRPRAASRRAASGDRRRAFRLASGAAAFSPTRQAARSGAAAPGAADIHQPRRLTGEDFRHRDAVAGRSERDQQASADHHQRRGDSDGRRCIAGVVAPLRRPRRPARSSLRYRRARTGRRTGSAATNWAAWRCRYPPISTIRWSGCD